MKTIGWLLRNSFGRLRWQLMVTYFLPAPKFHRTDIASSDFTQHFRAITSGSWPQDVETQTDNFQRELLNVLKRYRPKDPKKPKKGFLSMMQRGASASFKLDEIFVVVAERLRAIFCVEFSQLGIVEVSQTLRISVIYQARIAAGHPGPQLHHFFFAAAGYVLLINADNWRDSFGERFNNASPMQSTKSCKIRLEGFPGRMIRQLEIVESCAPETPSSRILQRLKPLT